MQYDPKDLIGADGELIIPLPRKKQKIEIVPSWRGLIVVLIVDFFVVMVGCGCIMASIRFTHSPRIKGNPVMIWGLSGGSDWSQAMYIVCEESQAEQLTQAYLDSGVKLERFTVSVYSDEKMRNATGMIVAGGERDRWAATFTVVEPDKHGSFLICIDRIDVTQGNILGSQATHSG